MAATGVRDEDRSVFTIRCEERGQDIAVVLEFLKSCGWLPYYGFTPPELRDSHFGLVMIRKWEERDLDKAEMLRLTQFGTYLGPLVWFRGYTDGRFVGAAKSIGADNPVAWDEPFGNGDGHRDYFVHPTVKSAMERELKGCRFVPLEWDRPELAKGEFWEIDPEVIMPPCRTKLVLTNNEWWFEEGGYHLAQVSYQREEVAALGEFDMAWTHEITGETAEDRPNYRGRILIVSQRFRRFFQRYVTREDQRLCFEPVKLI